MTRVVWKETELDPYAGVVIVRFPAYRRYSEARVEVSDSMMALLIGARLGEHALKTSPASSDARLPDLFGQIPGISRVNRTAADAAALLAGGELHLTYMAIPYALSVHASFVIAAARMVRQAGLDSDGHSHQVPRQPHLESLPLDVAHEYVAERCNWKLDTDLLAIFHLARRIRNRIIHFGGDAGANLVRDYRAMPAGSRASWENLAKRSLPAAIYNGRMQLAEPELVAVLATGRHLAHEVNDMIAHRLPREFWARVAVNDYRLAHPQHFGERATRLRRVKGHADSFYSVLRLTDDELVAAGAGGK